MRCVLGFLSVLSCASRRWAALVAGWKWGRLSLDMRRSDVRSSAFGLGGITRRDGEGTKQRREEASELVRFRSRQRHPLSFRPFPGLLVTCLDISRL
jgi:hypothetical protein